jgi:signal transduction histidine kinase
VGINPDERGQVFEKFYRGRRTQKKPGTGLGLSIARAVIDAHGGTIAVSAGSAGGTIVTIEFPTSSGNEGEERYHADFSD